MPGESKESATQIRTLARLRVYEYCIQPQTDKYEDWEDECYRTYVTDKSWRYKQRIRAYQANDYTSHHYPKGKDETTINAFRRATRSYRLYLARQRLTAALEIQEENDDSTNSNSG